MSDPKRRRYTFHGPHFSLGVGNRRIAQRPIDENADTALLDDPQWGDLSQQPGSDCMVGHQVTFLSGRPELGTDDSARLIQDMLHDQFGLARSPIARCDRPLSWGSTDCLVVLGDDLSPGESLLRAVKSHCRRGTPVVCLAADQSVFRTWPEFDREILGVRRVPLGYNPDGDAGQLVRVPGESRHHPAMRRVVEPFRTPVGSWMTEPCRRYTAPLAYGFFGDRAVPIALATEDRSRRAFHTSLGVTVGRNHDDTRDDFRSEMFRYLATDAILWASGVL